MTHSLIMVCCLVMAVGSPSQSPSQQNQDSSVVESEDQSLPRPFAESTDGWVKPQPTAEELLRALKRQRPVSKLVRPVGAAADPKSQVRRLSPEGTAVVDRHGRLTHVGHWWVFASDSPGSDPPVKLLPNRNLEVMARTVAASASREAFSLSGEMTVFRGDNYLLARTARRLGGANTAGKAPPVPAGDRARTAANNEPGDAEILLGDKPGKFATSAEDVLSLLKKQKPTEPLLSEAESDKPPVAASSRRRSMGDSIVARTLVPEGTRLINRSGRLSKVGDWWLFSFESDHPDHPELPMKLLPNESVDLMMRAVGQGDRGLVFLVSGEVTVFEGENYLLPRVAMRRLPNDNLRP